MGNLRLNGRLVLIGAYLISPTIRLAATTYTDNHTVTWDQAGHRLIMNSASNKTFVLPSGSATYIGSRFSFANINTGRLTIQAAANNYIDDSSLSGADYCDTDLIADITLELVSATRWHIVSANATWVTT